MKLLLFLFPISFLFLFLSFPSGKHPDRKFKFETVSYDRFDSLEKLKLIQKEIILKKFLKEKNFNMKYCFLVDMNLPSGKNRFFVFDIEKDSIVISGLVAHGHCNIGFCPTPSFSNKEKSCCTALGKYRIGGYYKGQYGPAYKLYGLDNSNSNAYKRNIVLHAYPCVPEKETYPDPICNSSGCPMLTAAFLKKLQPFIDKAARPVVLWIFE